MAGFVSVWIIIATCLASFANSFAISGVSGGVDQTTGQRPFRQEFSSFKASGPAFDLYILSLQEFQQQNQAALLSYYQVTGECNRGDTADLLLTVHLRYSRASLHLMGWRSRTIFNRLLYTRIHSVSHVASTVSGSVRSMYEARSIGLDIEPWQQILWGNAQTIAATYPVSRRSQYQAAAKTFRIPYWDWVFNATMPDLVNQPTININSPHGALNMANPLYSYTFHPQPSAADFPPSEGVGLAGITVEILLTLRSLQNTIAQ